MLHHIFDTHAHYDDNRFDADRAEVIAGLQARGVQTVLNAACDMPSCETGLALAEQYAFFYCSVGVHPHSASDFGPGDLERLAAYTKRDKVRAIGEIGLDYHYDYSPRDVQKQVFEAQLALAVDLDVPVIIHDREAHGDTMDLLRKYRPQGIVHCYSGSVEMARELVAMGMYIAFGGSATFANASKLREAVVSVPQERILLETDCPYMAPLPFRGRRCDSGMIAQTAEILAPLRGEDPQQLLDVTYHNACSVYRIGE